MTPTLTLSRRELLKGLASAAALGSTSRASSYAEGPMAAREKLSLMRYRDVKLTGGPLKAQFDRIHAAYLALDEDGLLKELRVRAGLPAPGEYPGGWYDRDGFAPGHCFGQLISALARFSEATGDEATRAKTQRLTVAWSQTAFGADLLNSPSNGSAAQTPRATTRRRSERLQGRCTSSGPRARRHRQSHGLPAPRRSTSSHVRCARVAWLRRRERDASLACIMAPWLLL